MKKIYGIVIMMLLSTLSLCAQEPLYPLDKITHLQLYSNHIYPCVYENNLYTARYFLGANSPQSIHESSHHETKEYLEGIGATIIPIDDMDKLTQDELLSMLSNKEWIIGESNTTIETLQLIQPNFRLYRLYTYSKDYSFVSNEEKNWNIASEMIEPIYFVSLPNNAIYLQGVGNNSSYIVPYKGKLLTGFALKSSIGKEMNHAKYGINKEKQLYQTLQFMNIERYYFIQPVANNKVELRDKTGRLLLDGQFDEIITNRYFLVTKNKETYDIYNGLLMPIERNARSYHFDGYYIHILKNNELTHQGVLGKKEMAFKTKHFKCGREPFYDYEIVKNDHNSYDMLIGVGSRMDKSGERGKPVPIQNSGEFSTIHWLDGTSRIGYSSLDHKEGGLNLPRELVQVEKNKKVGIALVEYNQTKISIKPLSEINYDAVLFTSYEEPLQLKKEGKIYLFVYLDKKAVVSKPLKSVGKRDKFFIRYEDENGTQGWFDLAKGIAFDDA